MRTARRRDPCGRTPSLSADFTFNCPGAVILSLPQIYLYSRYALFYPGSRASMHMSISTQHESKRKIVILINNLIKIALHL